jgi:hypothetical protein
MTMIVTMTMTVTMTVTMTSQGVPLKVFSSPFRVRTFRGVPQKRWKVDCSINIIER